MPTTIFEQTFNALSGLTATADAVPDGGALTNTASSSVDGPGIDFRTLWFDTRNEGAGPAVGGESGDFIGVNDFGGTNAPDVAADGSPVGGTEKNFQFNDGDGRLELTFAPLDLSAYANRTLSLNYWIAPTGYESDDAFRVTLSDGTTSVVLLELRETGMEGAAAGDAGLASEWSTLTVDLDAEIAAAGLDASAVTLVVAADTNAGSENIFVDNIAFQGDPAGPVPTLINEFQPNPEGTDPARVSLEIKGAPGAAFSGFLFSLEADADAAVNEVERKSAIAGTFDADGLLTVEIPDLENPSFTLVLTANDATAAIGDTVDPADPAALGTILDAIGVADNGTDPVAGALLGGTDIAYTGDEPRLVFRDGRTDALYAVNDPDNGVVFDASGAELSPAAFDTDPLSGPSFGAVNPTFQGDGGDEGGPDAGPIVLISAVQGSGDATPIAGQTVTIQGVVTANFAGTLNGFFVQEEDRDADGDAATSDGIFVFAPNAGTLLEGYTVTVTGVAGEFFDQTQISADTITVESADVEGGLALVTPSVIDLPLAGDLDAAFEAREGMLVRFADTLSVTQLFGYERYGEVGLSEGGRIFQYTQTEAPDVAGYAAFQEEQLARRITLDDGSDAQNPDTLPFLDVTEFGGGDTIDDLTGVLRYSFGSFKVAPTEANPIVVTNANPRADAPEDVGGSLKVASFNVLNYFTTLDIPGNAGSVNGQDPRGANSVAELDRQAGKIVAALDEMDADVVGLIEIENDEGAAMQDLVDRLNAVSDRNYTIVDTGVIGTDAIKVGFIYDADTVRIAPGTEIAILDSPEFVSPVSETLDPNDVLSFDPKNRPALAVTFEEIATGGQFTAVNNHFKSKGSGVEGEDFNLLTGDDLGTIDGAAPVIGVDDGQGNGSATRESAADQLVDWLATNPTGSADADLLILGDLNSYAAETAIAQITQGADDIAGTDDDFVDLAQAFVGEDAYSYRFSGQWGTLDYALANTALLGQVTGATEWHVNSDEPTYLDYQDGTLDPNERSFEVKPDAIEAKVDPDSPYSSSDHDPVLIGLDLTPAPGLFSLELLHVDDRSADAIAFAPGLSAVLRALKDQDLGGDGVPDNTITLAATDFTRSNLLAEASGAVFGGAGRADVLLANALDVDAVALGAPDGANLVDLLAGDGAGYAGAAAPYLSADLIQSGDPDLASLVVAGAQAPEAGTLTSSVTLDVNGALAGVIGGIGLDPRSRDAIQAEIDTLTGGGIDRIVLMASGIEGPAQDVIGALSGVDVVVSSGLLVDGDDILHAKDDAGDIDGPYPTFYSDADGNPVALVGTDGTGQYVGRLVIDFDADGVIVPGSYDPSVSGAYATDAEGVARLGDEGLVDPEVQDIADRLDAFANTVVGYTDVFLDGRPGEVGREETNLGNLLADASLAAARAVDPSVLVSLKGAGGIAGALGDADTGTPPEGGGITVADHFEVLPEDGDLVLLTLTGAQLVEALEHAVSADTAETRFAQVSGVEFSFDPTAPAGTRIQSAQVVGTDGTPLVDLVYRGAVLEPDATIRIVTTRALAEGGEGYPFAEFRADDPDRLDPVSLGSDERSGAATFADDGTGLDALAEYLAANHGTEATAFDQAETPPSGDTRIQNLDQRGDDVFEFDTLVFGDGGRVQRFDLGAGIDKLALDDELSNGIRQRFLVRGFEEGDMPGFDRDDILSSREAGPNLLVYIDNDDRDSFTFFGVDSVETLFGSTDLA